MDTIILPTVQKRILFVGSNPSVKSKETTPFYFDSRSYSVLNSWISRITENQSHSIFIQNISNDPTDNNRPLKMKEIRLLMPLLQFNIESIKPDKIIALGNTAEKALTLLQLPHYKLPHPSPKNRKLNDKNFVE